MKFNNFKGLLYFLAVQLLAVNAVADGPVDVTRCFDGMHLEMRDGWVGNTVYVDLDSFDGRTAYCSVEFKNGPERRTRKTEVEAEESKTVTFSPRREVIRLRITVRCAESRDRLKNKSAVDDSCKSGSSTLSAHNIKKPASG
jgi:hypothetical protein